MQLSLLACVALTMAATLPQPVHSLKFEARAPPSVESEAKEGGGGWGIFKHVLDTASQIAGTIHDEIDSLSASAHKWYDGLHLTDVEESLWVKVMELGQSTDALFRHATELYPSEKVHEFKASVDSMISTTTTLHQMVLATAEEGGVPPDSLKEEFEDILNAVIERLKELFPPPTEAPRHEDRTAMVNAVLDLIDESFSQFVIKLGVSEESLKTYSDPLKLHVQFIIVTIVDVIEQHPELALTLLLIVIVETGIFDFILAKALKILGFGGRGPIGGSLAAWVQGWFYPSGIPKGGWFATLQRLAMTL